MKSTVFSVTEAQQCVLQHASLLIKMAEIPLLESLGRVLAKAVYADRNQPPRDISAMDGFAVNSADFENTLPKLQIIEDIKAGDIPTKTLKTGQCARIMTGAFLPEGANAVLRVEDTQENGDFIVCTAKINANKDVRFMGEAMQEGQCILEAGTEITPAVIGVLAACKCANPSVFVPATVAILSTGDELEALNAPRNPLQIPDSNAYALYAQTKSAGANPQLLGIAPDDQNALAALIQQGLAADILLISGGSSVGTHDHVRPILESLNVTLHFWRISMRPGHPLAFGSLTHASGKKNLVFGLPGNPVSSMVCFEEYVLPLLRQMNGLSHLFLRTIKATLGSPFKVNGGRTEFVRVTLSQSPNEEGKWLAHPTGTQSSGVLQSMAQAEGFLVVPANVENLNVGDTVLVQLNHPQSAFQKSAGLVI